MASRVRRVRVRTKSAPRTATAPATDVTLIDMLAKYRQHVTAAVIAIAIAVVIVLAYSLNAVRVNERALVQLEDARRAENPETRIGILTDMLERYPRATAAFDALYMLGNVYYESEQYDEARETFERLLDKYPQSYYAPMAEEALGYIAEAKGKPNEAVEHFERVTQDYSSSYVARRAYMQLGRLFEDLGENAKAAQAYENLLSRHPGSEYIDAASERLAALQPTEQESAESEPADPVAK